MMTKKNALTIARNIYAAATIDATTAEVQEVLDVLDRMIEQLSKPRTVSPEHQAAINANRKAATAKERRALVAQVAPILRDVLTHTQQGMTAKEIFSDAASRLPADFSAPKVQNILLREMRPELEIIEAKGKANLYRLIER